MSRYDKTIEEIRKFNRFYTVTMGFLDQEYLDTKYSIAETRILFEIKTNEKCIQSDIAKTLRIDKSYLSRIMKRFYKNGLIEKDRSDEDKRATYISLTEKGRLEAERLIGSTNDRIKAQIERLSFDECKELCDAMHVMISILERV